MQLLCSPWRLRVGGQVAMTMAVAACVSALGLAMPQAQAADIRVVDDSGATLVLREPARRIISLAPHLTEQLFAVGAGDRVVGVVAHSDHPAQARLVPRIGDSTQLDLERIVSLRPDLIVAWDSGNAAPQLLRLAALGLAIYRSEARKFADISSTLRRLGQLTAQDSVARNRADVFDASIASLRERYAARRELSVFYQIWHQPLLTVNGSHLISQALTLCGARNVFADLRALTPSVSEEAVLVANPQAIVTGSVDTVGRDNLDRWRQRKGLRAQALGNLIVINPDTLHRASDRIVDGVAELCEKLDAARVRSAATGPAQPPGLAPPAQRPAVPTLKSPG